MITVKESPGLTALANEMGVSGAGMISHQGITSNPPGALASGYSSTPAWISEELP
ncbi:MAG: hypothetical protein WBA31_07660 [Candidatus Dormiibacterota bacterium]